MMKNTSMLSVDIITFVLGFPTNVLAFYAFCKKVRQKAIPTDILLLNLSLSDLLFLIFLPFKMQEDTNNTNWALPYVVCRLSVFVFFMTIYNSISFLTAVSVERYIGVVFPTFTLGRRPVYAVAASIFFWILSFVHMSIIFALSFSGSQKHRNVTVDQNTSEIHPQNCYDQFDDVQLHIILPIRLELFVLLFCIPFFICCFCYINVIRVLSKMQRIDRRRRLRAIGMAVGTLIMFAVCFGPYNISHLVGFIAWESPEWRDTALLCSTFNACLDPFIFYMSSTAVRGTVGSMMKGLKCRFSRCVPSYVFCASSRSINMTGKDTEDNQEENNGGGKEAATSRLK